MWWSGDGCWAPTEIYQTCPKRARHKVADRKMTQETSTKGPVIILTGTPGTGKTTHSQLLAEESPVPLKHINVGDLVKEKNLYEEYNEEWQSYTVDEDKVCYSLYSSCLKC